MPLLDILPWSVATLLVAFVLSFYTRLGSRSEQDGKEPESFPEWIPGMMNAYKYIFDNMNFLAYASKILDGRTIMKFWIGPKRVYMVTGAKNVQAVIRNSGHLSSDELMNMVLPQLDNVSKKDMAVFKADKSGRGHTPLDDTPVDAESRIWAQAHRIMLDHLSSGTAVDVMTAKFCELFSTAIEKRKVGEWETTRLYEFLKLEMVECAITSLSGLEILKQNSGFIDAMWAFDAVVYPLSFGVPKWLYRKAYAARDRFHDMGEKWMRYAWENYDWDSPDVDWDEMFGSRYSRVQGKFLKEKNFDLRSRVGLYLGSIFAQNANTVPVTAWAMIELIKDKALVKSIRAEATTALAPDSTPTNRKFDMKKLAHLPLLQSVYAETMRMHVSINVTRGVTDDMQLDGYALKKGSLIQAPSMVEHFNPEVWSQPGHPANEFWAERFISYAEETDDSGAIKTKPRFSITGKAGSFFPYGGGVSICAGRHFAKQEIMAAIALLVVNFDIELIEYVKMDGSKSDRGPKDHPWWCGTAAMPPDRDLKIRWKRI